MVCLGNRSVLVHPFYRVAATYRDRVKPEVLEFSPGRFYHDSGRPVFDPFRFSSVGSRYILLENVKELFKKRRIVDVSPETIANVRLENFRDGSRFTYDLGADRIEMGSSLREPEREWLAQVVTAAVGKNKEPHA